jgi:hypothetical protein
MDNHGIDKLVSVGIKAIAEKQATPHFGGADLDRQIKHRRTARRIVGTSSVTAALAVVSVALLLLGPATDEPGDIAASDSAMSPDRGSLTADEYRLAMKTANEQQQAVTGTFVGATASGSDGKALPFNTGESCPDARLVHIRLVWNADANFESGGAFAEQNASDGPRKARLITIESTNGRICESSAAYRNVGALPTETLLFGAWPDPKDG